MKRFSLCCNEMEQDPDGKWVLHAEACPVVPAGYQVTKVEGKWTLFGRTPDAVESNPPWRLAEEWNSGICISLDRGYDYVMANVAAMAALCWAVQHNETPAHAEECSDAKKTR